MRPRSQCPLSLTARKFAPLASTRIAERPPKCGCDEVSSSPPRNVSAPNFVRIGLPGSNAVIGRARISILVGCSGGRGAGWGGGGGGRGGRGGAAGGARRRRAKEGGV